jgi:uncharacterized protein YabE (DUF348 family)
VRRVPIRAKTVVLAALLAMFGTTLAAFATMDKTVRLDVDGRQVAVRTFAGTVAGVLRHAHLSLGPHDLVAPDAAAPVGDGTRIVVRHGRLLSIVVDGAPRQVWVTALSVQDALGELGVTADGAWLSVSRSMPIPRRGLAVSLRLPQRVAVVADRHLVRTTTTAADVSSLLASLGITLQPQDVVSVPLTAYPTTGMTIRVQRVTRRPLTRKVAIPFGTRLVRTRALYVGQRRLVRHGRAGVRLETFAVTYRDGRRAGVRLVSRKVLRKPVAAVVQVGARQRPRYAPSADGLDWAALARCESGGNPRAVSPDGRYRGLYQFTLGTWHGLGGSGDPIDASSSEQTYRAQILYRRSGASAWPSCGHYLYS